MWDRSIAIDVISRSTQHLEDLDLRNDEHKSNPTPTQAWDPLQGIGGPMTRSKTKRMKEALHGLILEVHNGESKDMQPTYVNLLQVLE